MTAQWTITVLVVVASACYAGWTLLPASLRRVLATAALRLPLPGALAVRLRGQTTDASGCACSGCDRNPLADKRNAAGAPGTAPAAVRAQPITLHRRLPR
jgi:hypothetical protein